MVAVFKGTKRHQYFCSQKSKGKTQWDQMEQVCTIRQNGLPVSSGLCVLAAYSNWQWRTGLAAREIPEEYFVPVFL